MENLKELYIDRQKCEVAFVDGWNNGGALENLVVDCNTITQYSFGRVANVSMLDCKLSDVNVSLSLCL